jgi:uncharacterized repeat protein (TIGR03803 family)
MSHHIVRDQSKRQSIAPSIFNPARPKIWTESPAEQKPCRPTPAPLAFRRLFAIAIFSAMLLAVARPAHAQTETILYNFPVSSYGCCGGGPTAHLTSDGNGSFYGTTPRLGAYNNGSVFEVTPNGSEYEITLYSFCSDAPSCPDGWDPAYSGVIRDKSGNLYATTAFGGANGCGTVYELSPSGSSWSHNILYSFPAAPSGSGNDNNCTPLYGVVMDKAGNLYGTTSYGAVSDTGGPTGHGGAVFELSPAGNTWTEKLLYTYPYGSDSGVLLDTEGNLFAIGANSADYPYLFELSLKSSGGWTPRVIYRFDDLAQGWSPTATPVADSSGNLYGTTSAGGPYPHAGVVYEVVKGQGSWTYKDLFNFDGTAGGETPFGGVVVGPNGTIYGTTQYGGANSDGIVFALVPNAGGYKETVFSFNGVDGNAPMAGVTLYDGNIYGTTSAGGNESSGVVFELVP